MKFNRSVFWKVLGVFVILDLCWLMCACGDWETQASNIITLLGPAIQAALAILAAFGVGVSSGVMTAFQQWSAQAQTDLTTLKSLIASYKAALSSAQPGILNEIISVVNTTSANLTSILSTLHITDTTTQTRIEAVFAAITGMLTAILNLAPAITSGSKIKEAEKMRLYAAFKTSASNFRQTFNAAAGVFGKQYEI